MPNVPACDKPALHADVVEDIAFIQVPEAMLATVDKELLTDTYFLMLTFMGFGTLASYRLRFLKRLHNAFSKRYLYLKKKIHRYSCRPKHLTPTPIKIV